MKKIAWLPENLNNNRSFYGLKKATTLAGAENISEKDLYKNPRKVDYLVLNFYEDIQKKFGFHLIAYVGRWIRLHYFKFCGIKIITDGNYCSNHYNVFLLITQLYEF